MCALADATQAEWCARLAEADGGASFGRDRWQREQGGGGLTRVFAGGALFARAGVNVSQVHGQLSEAAAAETGGGRHLTGPRARDFRAVGVSLVLHPASPQVPTVHANYRYFERGDGEAGCWWFGGGSDLTPTYLFDEDAAHFHRTLKAACDRHGPALYPAFKAGCDRYFWLPHRGEARGVGGIFFDGLDDRPPGALLDLVADLAAAFLPSYLPIVARRRDLPYDDAALAWQALRRGRYAEFNLACDRGTLFGLRSGGRTESILMSLPPSASWAYDHQPAAGSREAELMAVLRAPRAWAEVAGAGPHP